MPDGIRRVYLDADVFLSYVNEHPERVDVVEAVLAEGRRWAIRLYTSMLTTTEVAFGAQEQFARNLDEETEARINTLWLPGSPIELVEFHRLIADDARSLMRFAITQGWRLKPADAIHLATARRVEAQELFTYNLSDFEKFSEITGLTICQPYAVQPKLPEPRGP